MTGTLAQEQGYGLDPRPSHDADENHAEPILAACEIDAERTARMAVRFSAVRREPASSLHGYTMATLCRMHLVEPKSATCGAILAKCIVTKADAITALDLGVKPC